MHGKRACLIVNPRDGKNLEYLSEIVAVLNKAGYQAKVMLKERGGETIALAKQAAERNSDLIIAYGGDGTLSQVINGLMQVKEGQKQRIVGLIPGGTANVWATEVGIPTDPVQAAHTLLDSETRKIDLGYVDVEKLTMMDSASGEQSIQDCRTYKNKHRKKITSKSRHYFLLMAGLGIDAAVMGDVSKPLKYQIGPLAVGLSAVKTLPRQQPFAVELLMQGDGKHEEVFWRGEAVQVVIGNTRRYADVVKMTPDAYIDDGVLNTCVILTGDPLTTVAQLASLLFRRQPDNLTAEFFQAAHFSLRVPASAPLQLDGSAMKLRSYLDKANRDILKREEEVARVMVEYRFAAVPQALNIAIPCTYNGALFKSEKDHG
jgi:YegS/Rv2252/BmrU family lipid kinase